MLEKYFLDLTAKLNGILEDLSVISANLNKREVEEKNKENLREISSKRVASPSRIVSTKSVEPMSRLRANVAEVKAAEENPEIQFVLDRVADAFK